MPSDTRWEALVALFAPAADPFMRALAETARAAREQLAEDDGAPEPAAAARAALGPFGATHVDLAAFGQRFEAVPGIAGAAVDAVRRALTVLDELEARGRTLWTGAVPDGAGLADTVQRYLAEAGRAFGAARVVRAARAGGDLDGALGALVTHRFERWTRSERLAAPPLLLRVRGDDLRPAALADVLDGHVRITLLVEGPCAVAPLARLLTPGTWVQQATDPTALGGFAEWQGPGIAAVVPEGSAVFTQDPRTGLAVAASPGPRGPVAGMSVAQQRDELALLERFARPAVPDAAPPPAPDPGTTPEDPAGRLAAWLIARSGIGEG